MIGVFDSGEGGRLAVEKIRELSEKTDIAFIADTKNAPYGTKTREEIITYAKTNIQKLKAIGAKKILIACCTASTVYPYLSREEREISIPIIDSTAREAVRQTKNARLGVIATYATVRSGAFRESILKYMPTASVTEIEAQELVGIIENGAADNNVDAYCKARLEKILESAKNGDFDTLILGCTHFPRLEKTISQIIGKKTVSSALVGAMEILKYCNQNENGRLLLL